MARETGSSAVWGAGDRLLVIVSSESEVEVLLKLLAAQNGKLVSLIPRTRTLEDFFMSQVRGQEGVGKR